MFLNSRKCLLNTLTVKAAGVKLFCRNYYKILINEEVRFALNNNKPVVALESTIITHGMPYPDNIKCALDVEAIIRNQVKEVKNYA